MGNIQSTDGTTPNNVTNTMDPEQMSKMINQMFGTILTGVSNTDNSPVNPENDLQTEQAAKTDSNITTKTTITYETNQTELNSINDPEFARSFTNILANAEEVVESSELSSQLNDPAKKLMINISTLMKDALMNPNNQGGNFMETIMKSMVSASTNLANDDKFFDILKENPNNLEPTKDVVDETQLNEAKETNNEITEESVVSDDPDKSLNIQI